MCGNQGGAKPPNISLDPENGQIYSFMGSKPSSSLWNKINKISLLWNFNGFSSMPLEGSGFKLKI